MEELKCPICGKPTRIYMGNARRDRLCGTHADQLKAEEIYLDENGIYRSTKTKKSIMPGQETPAPILPSEEKKKISIDTPYISCLICGEDSNGMHFCKKCYHKYREGAIDLRIIHCAEVEILDKYGNKKIFCMDGRQVRSKSEKIIADYLFYRNIRFSYEKTIYYYKSDGTTIELHPDFYIERDGRKIILEHNGLENKWYLKKKEETKEYYESLGYEVITTNDDDISDLDRILTLKLRIN